MFMCTKSIFIGFLLNLVTYGSSHDYSLEFFEQVALKNAPELEEHEHTQKSLEASSIAANQLPDPTLQIGAINIPTDTFSLTQENMTQIKFGIVQTFPRGNSLNVKSQQKKFWRNKNSISARLPKKKFYASCVMIGLIYIIY